jgi:outer membrane protein assembly factor BamB
MSKPNPNSAVVWHTRGPLPKDAPVIETGGKNKRDLLRTRDYIFGRSYGGCAAQDGLVYATEGSGFLFCFDAKTGKLYWGEDLRAGVRGQPLWVDGKVLVATDSGLFAFAHGKEKKLVAKIESEWGFRSGPVFANGTLYLTEFHKGTLYAIHKEK